MSDEHNTPEISSVAKPRRTRRPASTKKAAETVTMETQADTPSAPDTPATPRTPKATPKPDKARASRPKSSTKNTAEPRADDETTSPSPAPKATRTPRARTPRAPRVTTPKPSAAVSAAVTPEVTKTELSVSTTSSGPTSPAAPAAPTASAVTANAEKKSHSRSTSRKPAPSPASPAVTATSATAESSEASSALDAPVAPLAPKTRSRRTARGSTPRAATHETDTHGTAPQRLPVEQPTAAPNATPNARPSAVTPLSKAVPALAAEDSSASAPSMFSEVEPSADEDDAQDTPRKSRRGRRGGRGRGRKGRQTAPMAENQAADQAADQVTGRAADRSADRSEDTLSAAKPLPVRFDDEDDMDGLDGMDDEDTDNDAPAEVSPKAPQTGRRASSAKKVTKEKDTDTENKPGRRKMFISVVPGEQVEVALVEEGVIGEYYLDMLHQAKTKGNIYKGVVHNVDPNLQAAFVNYGGNKNGFLQIDEIHPEYYLAHHEALKGKKFPPIQKVIKPGQEVLVQVVKEPTGNKGAFLTTWLSLAGRFLVLTPGQEQIGVSRKVDNDEERARLREMMNGIEPGEGLGVIVRTVSAGTSKTTLKNDLQYLKRVWKEIRRRGTSEGAPSLVYQESSLAERAVRDYLTEDVCEVWVDNETVAESLRETVALLFPRKEDLVRVHVDLRQTLWERFNIQRQLEQIYSREVTLPSGGRLVFDQTEALMAIDINSGKISGKANFESMALKTNIEAAEAIARHFRLRDIGGQVVIDFIEMRDKNHVREVEKTLRNAMKNDRARHDVARMSSFGLLEIVRQRTGSSALAVTMEPCPSCHGTGIRRNMEWQSLQALRQIGRQARTSGNGPCIFEANTELGMYLLNHKRDRLREMEQQLNISIVIQIQA